MTALGEQSSLLAVGQLGEADGALDAFLEVARPVNSDGQRLVDGGVRLLQRPALAAAAAAVAGHNDVDGKENGVGADDYCTFSTASFRGSINRNAGFDHLVGC